MSHFSRQRKRNWGKQVRRSCGLPCLCSYTAQFCKEGILSWICFLNVLEEYDPQVEIAAPISIDCNLPKFR